MSVIMEDEGKGRIKVERLRESERAKRMNNNMSFRFHTKRPFCSFLFCSVLFCSVLFCSSTTFLTSFFQTRSVVLLVYSDQINHYDQSIRCGVTRLCV